MSSCYMSVFLPSALNTLNEGHAELVNLISCHRRGVSDPLLRDPRFNALEEWLYLMVIQSEQLTTSSAIVRALPANLAVLAPDNAARHFRKIRNFGPLLQGLEYFFEAPIQFGEAGDKIAAMSVADVGAALAELAAMLDEAAHSPPGLR